MFIPLFFILVLAGVFVGALCWLAVIHQHSLDQTAKIRALNELVDTAKNDANAFRIKSLDLDTRLVELRKQFAEREKEILDDARLLEEGANGKITAAYDLVFRHIEFNPKFKHFTVLQDVITRLQESGFAVQSFEPESLFETYQTAARLSPELLVAAEMQDVVEPLSTHLRERDYGGDGYVYGYTYPSYVELANLHGEHEIAIKIGSALNDWEARIAAQQSTSNHEKPIVLLRLKKDEPERLERMLHHVLKTRGKHLNEGAGNEWFKVNPDAVVRAADKLIEAGIHL